MTIKKYFEYDADWDEIADEFMTMDSAEQSQVLNSIGLTFKIWTKDKKRPATYVQLSEIAEDLDDNGKWLIEILYDYMNGSENK